MLIHNTLTVNEVTVLSVKEIKYIVKPELTKCQLADFYEKCVKLDEKSDKMAEIVRQ